MRSHKSIEELSNEELFHLCEPAVIELRAAAGKRTAEELLAPITMDELQMLSAMGAQDES